MEISLTPPSSVILEILLKDAVPVPEPTPVVVNVAPTAGCLVIVVADETYCDGLIVYVPFSPVPVPRAVIVVPAVIPVPLIVAPTASVPEDTPETVNVVPAALAPLLIVPVTTAAAVAPIATKLVVPTDTIVCLTPIPNEPAVTVVEVVPTVPLALVPRYFNAAALF
jgi:hypothetical protein